MRFRVKGLTHDHVDGSLAVLACLDDLYRISGIGRSDPRFKSPEALRAYFEDVHNGLVEKFGAVTSLLQTPEAIRLLAYEYGRLRHEEGYLSTEAKFAPQYSTQKGLTMRQAAMAFVDGLAKASREFGISLRPHLCIGREADPDVGVEIATIALELDGHAILDTACVEPGNPPTKHLAAYAKTFGSKVPRECHTGEWVEPEPAATYRDRLLANVRSAVYDLRCHGISQIIPLADDPELVAYVQGEGIRASFCPLSNLTLKCIRNVTELQIAYLLDEGVRCTLNSDDDLLLPCMVEVISKCDEAYRFTQSQARALQENALRPLHADR